MSSSTTNSRIRERHSGLDAEHTWLIDPTTGAIDQLLEDDVETDLDDTDLVRIDALPSRVWFRDTEDFADEISVARAARRLARAIQGRGAFRRFRDQLHDDDPSLLTLRYEFSSRRALRRAVTWLADRSLVDRDAAEGFLAEHHDIDPASAS